MPLRYKLAVAAATLAAFGSTALAAQANQLRIYGSKCLDDTNWSRTPGQTLQIWQCTGGSNQQWDRYWEGPVYLGESSYVVYQNRYSHLCLSVKGDNSAPGTRAIQWYCSAGGDDAELFYSVYGVYNAPGYQIADTSYPVADRTCLDNWYNRNANGNPVDFYTCNGTPAQDWTGAF
jgi:hypothetical protein